MKKNLNQSGREAYEKSLEKAKELLEDKEKTEAKVDEAYKKLDKIKSGPVTKLFEDIKLMLDLLRSYINGTYREVPFGSILAILGGIIYFVTPIDLIPDFLPGGYIDDALVIGLVLKQVQSDLDAFKEWKMH
ncbi:MAG TPA: YkvA family protein [Clostridia bacterium]|nr:YkvA family protein [Clostridia bacterium]